MKRRKRTSDAWIRAAQGVASMPHFKHYARDGGVWVCILGGTWGQGPTMQAANTAFLNRDAAAHH